MYVYVWGHRVGGTSVDITEQQYYSTKLVQYDNYFEISYCMYSSSSYEIRTLVYSNQIAGYEFTV